MQRRGRPPFGARRRRGVALRAPATSRAAARGSPDASTRSVATMSSVSRPGNPRQQIEVGGIQAVGIGDPVGNGDDDVADRIGGGFGDQPLAQRVLVAAAGLAHAALVLAKRLGQKPRLRPHPRGRRGRRSSRAERLVDQLLEPVDLLRLAAQLIVEAQHLGDEAGPELKRQLAAAAAAARAARLRDDVALERASAGAADPRAARAARS